MVFGLLLATTQAKSSKATPARPPTHPRIHAISHDAGVRKDPLLHARRRLQRHRLHHGAPGRKSGGGETHCHGVRHPRSGPGQKVGSRSRVALQIVLHAVVAVAIWARRRIWATLQGRRPSEFDVALVAVVFAQLRMLWRRSGHIGLGPGRRC